MDADAKLGRMRYMAKVAESNPLTDHGVSQFLDLFRALDSYLSQGGTPPADWAGGPDVPDEHIYVPAFDRPPVEPLGGPVPGVDGSHLPDDDVVQVLDERMLPPRRHLPEHPDQGCVRCGNPITWDGEAWVHVRDGVVRHPARAGLWPGAAIANDEPGR